MRESTDFIMEVVSTLRETIRSVAHLVSKENTTSPLQLNTRQCQLLAERASDVLTVLEELQNKFHRQELIEDGQKVTHNWTLAASELHRVLKDSEILIKDCCCNGQWLLVAIKQGNLRETFAKLLYDIQWYMSVLCGVNNDETDDIFDRSVCEGKLETPEGFMLSSAAKQDRKSLQGLLRTSHVCDSKICSKESCLAMKLLQKLNAEEEGFDFSTNLSKSLPPIFLCVDWQNLKRGRSLGRGAFAEVRETTWLGQKYAIKIFPCDAFSREIFRREIAVMAGLNHPQVIRIVCCSENDKNLGIVMERMYKSLFDLLQDLRDSNDGGVSPIPIMHLVDLMLQTAEGVRYLHSKNLAHRDLKAANILVQFADPHKIKHSSDGVSQFSNVYFSTDNVSPFIVKVADFGLTKMKHASTMQLTTNTGTPAWMAPEVFRNKDTNAPGPSHRFQPFKTDSYSFGLVCYEILTAETPYHEMRSKCSTTEFKERVKGGERPKLPVEIPVRLALLIQRCWDTNFRVRPDFSTICTELRYIKSLLLQGNSLALLEESKINAQGPWGGDGGVPPSGRLQAQGPWGGNGGGQFYDGLATSIKQIKLKYNTGPRPCIWYIEVEYDFLGKSYISGHGDASYGTNTVVIKIDGPSEYITQIEGWFGPTGVHVGSEAVEALTSLTIRTNEKTHGPFGGEGKTRFKSDKGQIIGFYGRCGMVIDQLGCFIAPAED